MKELYNLGDAAREHILNYLGLLVHSIYMLLTPHHTLGRRHTMLMTDKTSLNSRSVVFPKTLTRVWQRVNSSLYNDCDTQDEHRFCCPQAQSCAAALKPNTEDERRNVRVWVWIAGEVPADSPAGGRAPRGEAHLIREGNEVSYRERLDNMNVFTCTVSIQVAPGE